MTELFLTLIIIFGFICTFTVIAGAKSDRKLFPVISVFSAVLIIACAFMCAVEIKTPSKDESPSKAHISVTEYSEISEAEEAEAGTEESADSEKTVYITRTGKKYHYSLDCSDADFYECTLEQALERGLEPCGKCVQ